MAERKRSKDGKRETSLYRDDGIGEGGGVGEGGAGESGRAGGNLARDIGTEDALTQEREGGIGVTRVEKSDGHPHAEPKKPKR